MLNIEMEMTSQEVEDYLTQVMDEMWGKEILSPQSKSQQTGDSIAQPQQGCKKVE